MKITAIIAALILLQLSTKAQTIKYDTCQYLHQYEGEWKSISGQDTIRIYLRFQRDYSTHFGYVGDQLYGWFEYKSGGTIISSDYAQRFAPMSYDADDSTSNIGSITLKLNNCNNSCLLFHGTMSDIEHQVNNVHTYLDPTRTIMTWYQDNMFGYGGHPITLPRDMVLIKQ